jgi:hypothetical protein
LPTGAFASLICLLLRSTMRLLRVGVFAEVSST